MSEAPVMATLLGRTSHAVMRLLQARFAAHGYDLSVELWTLLVNVRACDGQRHQELADRTFRDKTTVSRLVARLEQRGLVRRTPGAHDRRHKRIHITDAGRALLDALRPLALAVQQEVVAGIDTAALECCQEVLGRVYANAAGREFDWHATRAHQAGVPEGADDRA